ncbi:MAG: hypothetical protein LBI88_02855 [Deltaproteobacteria bacterium]|nr:hypothetical protein [Deltaproteobacteria bacterium]
MPFAYVDPKTEKTLVGHEGWKDATTKFTAAEIAAMRNFPPGTWREIAEEEAQELQRPPPGEIIKAEIAELEAKQTARMLRGAALGNARDVEMLQQIESGIETLRQQLWN